MLDNIFFLNTDPEELVDKMWSEKRGGDASHYYTDTAGSAEWAIFIGTLFDVEYYVLDGKDGPFGDYPAFFVYVTIEGTPFDISGYHTNHQAIIDDNEFYSDSYGDVTYRKTSYNEVKELAGSVDINYFMKELIASE